MSMANEKIMPASATAQLVQSKFFDSMNVRNTEEALYLMGSVLQSSTQYAIVGIDASATIVFWNEGARLLYGYDPNEVVGTQNLAVLFTDTDLAERKPQAILEETTREGKWEGKIERIRKDGTRFTTRLVVTCRRGTSGANIGYVLISKDISEDMRLTEELEKTQSYTRSLIESNTDALMTTDPLGIISDVNQQMEKLTGYTRQDLVGSPFKNYFTEPALCRRGHQARIEAGRGNQLPAHRDRQNRKDDARILQRVDLSLRDRKIAGCHRRPPAT